MSTNHSLSSESTADHCSVGDTMLSRFPLSSVMWWLSKPERSTGRPTRYCRYIVIYVTYHTLVSLKANDNDDVCDAIKDNCRLQRKREWNLGADIVDFVVPVQSDDEIQQSNILSGKTDYEPQPQPYTTHRRQQQSIHVDIYYTPPLIGALIVALSDDAVWRLSVAYIGSKSRTERPRKTKIGIEVAHITRNSDTTFKVKRSKVKVTRPLYSPWR